RKVANQIVGNPVRQEHLSSCGVGFDDLVQVGSIGLWRAIDSYELSSGVKFLTYAAPAIRRSMSDLIRQYSRDTVWQLRHDKANAWKIIYLDEDLDDTEDDTVETLISSPCAKLPEQIYIEQETAAELHEAMDALPDRENVYVQYRFGFGDGKGHPLTETARYFHLTESRTKSVEHSALKLLRHELLIEIPERAYARAEDRLTKVLVAAGELHAVELRLKSQQKRGRKITAVVYEYLADCDGKWGELRYNFKDDTAEVLLLADWDTTMSHRFAMRAIEHFRTYRNDKLPDRIMLTFIGPDQAAKTQQM
ncbi:sigma-70 family RNA polymerase sigma factor, partial [uncultured Oscillibacter sp.]|uniref:sigma-70 family RNA polymerase sigma factor n=1 Tax=uncultured Oscillibacter sp. TaxID=876091 RepID=UPI00263438EA